MSTKTAWREARIDDLLKLIELTDVADETADDFSGGMKKCLNAATVLIHRPSLVFPNEGMTVFLTTQNLEEANQLSTVCRSFRTVTSSRRARPTR